MVDKMNLRKVKTLKASARKDIIEFKRKGVAEIKSRKATLRKKIRGLK